MGNIVVKLPDGSKKELATGATGLDLAKSIGAGSVSYTHLTLPTICSV